MKKRVIKIIKREAEDVSRPPLTPTADEILMQQQKDNVDGERDMTKAVKNWIHERRENSKAEEVFSTNRLFEWDDGGPTESAG